MSEIESRIQMSETKLFKKCQKFAHLIFYIEFGHQMSEIEFSQQIFFSNVSDWSVKIDYQI